MKKDVNVSLIQGGKLTRGGWLSIVSFLLVAVIALSVALGLVVKSGKEEEPAAEAHIGGGMVLPESAEGDGVSLVSMEIPKEQYEEYGIMPIAESAQQLTATVSPSSDNVYMVWNVAWKEGTSGKWGYGKAVTEYVTVTPTSDGALTANVQCLKSFGEQIIVTVAVLGKESVSASCTVDYISKVKAVEIEFLPGYWYASGNANAANNVDGDGSHGFIISKSSSGSPKCTMALLNVGDYTIVDTMTSDSDNGIEIDIDSGFRSQFISLMTQAGLSSTEKSTLQSALNSFGKKAYSFGETVPNITSCNGAIFFLFGGGGEGFNHSQSEEYKLAYSFMSYYLSHVASTTPVFKITVNLVLKYASDVSCTLYSSFEPGFFASDAISASFGKSSLQFGGGRA